MVSGDIRLLKTGYREIWGYKGKVIQSSSRQRMAFL